MTKTLQPAIDGIPFVKPDGSLTQYGHTLISQNNTVTKTIDTELQETIAKVNEFDGGSSRNYTFSGITLSTLGDTASWSSGTVTKTEDGVSTSSPIAGGSVTWTGTDLFIYYDEDTGGFESTTDLIVAQGTTKRQVVATYKGGDDLIDGLYAPILDGTRFLTGQIGANQLVAGEVITSSAQIRNLVVDRINITNGAVSDAGIITSYPVDGYVMDTVTDSLTWVKVYDYPKNNGGTPETSEAIYADGKYVMVFPDHTFGAEYCSMYSTDGVNWILGGPTHAQMFSGVAHNGSSLFVATGSGGDVSTSPDGITWTSRSAAAANDWTAVTFGNGTFVAVSTNGTNRVMTSPDGITWTSRSAAAANDWTAVTFGNGTFVAVSTSGTGNRVMTSPDGITWTSRTSAADLTWSSIAYGNGIFVAVAESGSGTANKVMTSPDGITWTTRTSYFVSSTDPVWKKVAYGNGLFVAVAESATAGEQIMTSPDGITWTGRSSGVVNTWYAVTYGANGWFAFGKSANGTDIISSSDGITWSPLRGIPGSIYSNLAYGNGLFVATGSGFISTSPDGVIWTRRTTPVQNSWTGVTYGNGTFVAVSTSGTGNRVMTSPDGITWTSRTSAADNGWISVAFGNGTFVALSFNGTNRVMTSPDGITWTSRSAAAANNWREVTFGNGTFVAVSTNGTNRVMTSTNGITWTSRSAASASYWESVTFGNGLFVATAGISGVGLMTSPDGITWTSRSSGLTNGSRSVAFGNGRFFLISPGDDTCAFSSDGISWSTSSLGFNIIEPLGGAIAAGNGIVCFIGSVTSGAASAIIPAYNTGTFIPFADTINYPIGTGNAAPSRLIFSPGLVGADSTVFVNNPTTNSSLVARFNTRVSFYVYADDTLTGVPTLVAERTEKTLECEWQNQYLKRLVGDDQPEGFVSPVVLEKGIDYVDGNVIVAQLSYLSYSSSKSECSIIRSTPGFSLSWSAFYK